MTLHSRIMNFFPLLHLLCIGMALLTLCYYHFLFSLLLLVFAIYLIPLLGMRIHHSFYPLHEGTSDLAAPTYSAWWGTHQLQAVFNAFPAFETLLRLIPGCYSSWLRCWGSNIGKKVYWTPHVEITDRSLLEIGDQVIFGDKVICYSHVVMQKTPKLLLYVKTIKIGNHVFIGAGSRLGPGTHIADFSVIPLLTDLTINQAVARESTCDA